MPAHTHTHTHTYNIYNTYVHTIFIIKEEKFSQWKGFLQYLSYTVIGKLLILVKK